MIDIILAILTLGLVIFRLSHITEKTRKDAWRWWHVPWCALLFTLVMYYLYYKWDIPSTSLFDLFYEDYQIEVVYCLLCYLIWIPVARMLKTRSMHARFIYLFRKVFKNNDPGKDKALPFPYFYYGEEVRSKAGRVFYSQTLKAVAFLVALVYAVSFVVVYYAEIDFYLISAFGILGILPILEYYIYLNAEVLAEEEVIDEGNDVGESDFDELWRLFVDRFDNYSVAWKKDADHEYAEKSENGFDKDIENLFSAFKEKRDGIIEDCDLVTAFSKLVPFFMQVIKEGRYVLVAFDIPKHFTPNDGKTFMDEIAQKLKQTLEDHFPEVNQIINFTVYDERSTDETFRNSVIMAPLSLLARKGLKDSHWLNNLGLITVVNVFDKGVSNLYESRKFFYMLHSVNTQYQILAISTCRKDIEPSFHQTWLTRKKMEEIKMKPYPRGARQYFLGYNFEEYPCRFAKVLRAKPTDPLYSGSEMLVFPLTTKVDDVQKTVTPVHNLDLAYTNTLEAIEEFNRFNNWLKKDFSVSAESITEMVDSHMLPVDEVVEEQVFSVIYDHENNAPVVYSKWMHLGYKENFSIVISKPYMFRDYFNDNHDYFVATPFSALQPRMCMSRVTLAIILLDLLRHHPQEEKQLKSHLLNYYEESEIVSVPSTLRDLFRTYFSADIADGLRTEEEIVFDGKEYQVNVIYTLNADTISLPYLDIITVKDTADNVLFDILQDLMCQNYVKGQYHSFSGRSYKILDYDDTNKTLRVQFDSISNVLFYKPVQRIVLSGPRVPIKDLKYEESWYHTVTQQRLSIKMEGFETRLSVKNLNWISFERYSSPLHDSSSRMIPATDAERVYRRGKVLKVSFYYLQKPVYLEHIEEIRDGLQILLYEAMQSLFPHHAQYLIVASEGKRKPNWPEQTELPWILSDFQDKTTMDGEPKDDTRPSLTYYFIEDAHIDLGLIGALSKDNLWYLMEYVFDYLMWLTEKANYPEGYTEYLTKKDADKLSFLKYGGSELPAGLKDIDLLINFIKDYFSTGDLDLLAKSRLRISDKEYGNCDFCGKEMKNSEMTRLGDGRMRCPDCSEDAVDTESQFRQLCDKAKELFKSYLDIDFSTIPHEAKLISAVGLHKMRGYEFNITNGYDARKILGLAWDKQKDVFYVENGRKPIDTLEIIVHEMTHIWEYQDKGFAKVKTANEDWVEGLAVWTELYLMGKYGLDKEKDRQKWLERTDEYGRGLKYIMRICPDNPYKYIKSVNAI